MKHDSSRIGRRALVVGGSLAGMLAARVVAAHVDEVIVLDREHFDGTAAPRMTAPQSFHLHVLLKGGENAMERLVPGFREAIESSGSEILDPARDILSVSDLGTVDRQPGDLQVHGQSRWLLESCLRSRVLALTGNIELRGGVTVRGLLHDAIVNRVTGVRLETRDQAHAELRADLVIDASGRGEGAIRWLTALGLPVPDIDEVKVDFAYASTVVRLAPDPDRDWRGLVSGNLPRQGARGAVLMPIEDGLHICSAGGRAGDYPPDDREGFIDFIRTLPYPGMAEELAQAEFLRPIKRLVYPANRLRHYERCAGLPAAFLPLGDAICSFNPTYGQGMSSAALQAEALALALAEHHTGDAIELLGQNYLDRASEVVQFPWRQANFNDFLYPSTAGDRSMFAPEETVYRLKLQVAANRDPQIRRLLAAVQHFLEPFSSLVEDDVRARVAELTAA